MSSAFAPRLISISFFARHPIYKACFVFISTRENAKTQKRTHGKEETAKNMRLEECGMSKKQARRVHRVSRFISFSLPLSFMQIS